MTHDRFTAIQECRNELDLRLYRQAEWLAKRPFSSLEDEAYQRRLAALLRAERDAVRQ